MRQLAAAALFVACAAEPPSPTSGGSAPAPADTGPRAPATEPPTCDVVAPSGKAPSFESPDVPWRAPLWPVPERWLAVGAGTYATCAIAADRSLWCWGDPQNAARPRRQGREHDWVAVDAGRIGCGLRQDGTVWCWTHDRWQMRSADFPARWYDGAHIDVAAERSSCTVTSTGKLSCLLPEYDPGIVATAVDDGARHTCALDVEGRIFCWGNAQRGQLNGCDESTPATGAGPPPGPPIPCEWHAPRLIAEPADWTAVSAGGYHSCGLRGAGALWCWGDNMYSQVGVDAPDPILRLAEVEPGSAWQFVSAGGWHTCGIRTSGRLACWGWNYAGQLGLGDTLDRATPTDLPGGQRWLAVAAGENHTCAIDSERLLWCWGDNAEGQLGTEPVDLAPALEPTLVSAVSADNVPPHTHDHVWRVTSGEAEVREVDAIDVDGDTLSISILPPAPSGSVELLGGTSVRYTPGPGGSDAFGVLVSDGQLVSEPVRIDVIVEPAATATPEAWLDVVAYGERSCAVAVDRTLWCWGRQRWDDEPVRAPQRERLSGVVSLLRGWAALTEDGELWEAWGKGLPPRLVSPGPWRAISSYPHGSCGLAENGSLWCGRAFTSLEPWLAHIAFRDLLGACGVTNTGGLTCFADCPDKAATVAGCDWEKLDEPGRARRSDGTWWEVGTQGYCYSGINAFAWPWTGEWLEESLGPTHGCAIRPDGSAACWGANDHGQLGTGDLETRPSAAPVAGDTRWRKIATGDGHTCAIDVDAHLWCWGNNAAGQIAAGDLEQSVVPVRVE
jgi:alpha-tubulin suppressor-like RCC1 family protein